MKKMWLYLFLLFSVAYADDITSSIKIRLKADLPLLEVSSVNPTPINGIYEVVAGRRVFYVDSSGRYAFLGNLLDLDNKKNLTKEKIKSITAIDWHQLPLPIALRQTIGEGNRRIAVFTDPDCPFCKQLEQDVIPKLKDVVVYYYLYPLKIHENGVLDSKAILCAQNPEETYLAWMLWGKKLPKQTNCRNALKLNTMLNIGKNIVEVDSTPTIVLPNGQIITGLVPADYLNKLITDTSGIAPQVKESAPQPIFMKKQILESSVK